MTKELDIPSSSSADLTQILSALLDKDLEVRLGATEAVLHPWLESVPEDTPTTGGS
jgi:hypothetical protein